MNDTPPIVWEPSRERIASATITRYRDWLNETRGLALEDYADLWQWSVALALSLLKPATTACG